MLCDDSWTVNRMKAICYVDGFNLFHALKELEVPSVKWLSLWTLSQSLINQQSDVLVGVVYFTAIAEWEPEKAHRHRQYIAALESTGVEVIKSRFQRVDRKCMKNACRCPFREEKETDVALATRVLCDALMGVADKQIVITADTDHTPLFKAIRRHKPGNELVVASTEARLGRAHALRQNATKYVALKSQRLRACLLPRSVYDANGKLVASCPARYLQ